MIVPIVRYPHIHYKPDSEIKCDSIFKMPIPETELSHSQSKKLITCWCSLTSSPLSQLGLVALKDSLQSCVLITLFLVAPFPLLGRQLLIHYH